MSYNFCDLSACWLRSNDTFKWFVVYFSTIYYHPPKHFLVYHSKQSLINWRCKKKDLRRYHWNSEIFSTNNYRMDWRHQQRWYMHIEFVHKTFRFRKHFGIVLTEEIRTAKFCSEVFWCGNIYLIYLNHHHTSLNSVRSFYRIKLQNYCDMVLLFAPSLRKRGCAVCVYPNRVKWIAI